MSNLGISISSFAYPLVVLEATGSAAEAGLVGSALAGTTFVLRLPAGALVDRWDRKRILVACDLGRALVTASLGIALALGHFYFVQVLLVAFVEGALGVLFGPAEAAAVRRVVAPEQLRDAVAGNTSRAAFPALLGGPLGGVLFGASRALPFLADSASYLVSLGCMLSLRGPLQDGPAPATPWLAGLFDGVRWIRAHRFLRALLLWFTGMGVVFNSIGLVSLVLAREQGASPRELGVMFAIVSAGGVAGALAAPLVLRRLSRRRVVVLFAWLVLAATLLLLAAESPYAIGALGALAFLLVPSVNALVLTITAEEAPEHLQGRALSAGIQIASLAAPVGPVVAGALLATLGTRHTIGAYAAALVVLAVLATLSRGLRVPEV